MTQSVERLATDWLIGDRMLVGARFSAPILLYNGSRVICGDEATRASYRTPTPINTSVKETVDIFIFSPSGPSWPVLG